jgi:hypothetical protein
MVMANVFCVHKSKKSSLKRLPFLPRIGVVVDIGGRQFVYRQAPILETLLNMKKTGFSLKNLVDVSFKQLREINIPSQKKIDYEPPSKKSVE